LEPDASEKSSGQLDSNAKPLKKKTLANPLVPLLSHEEESLEELAISIKMECLSLKKMIQCFLTTKQTLILGLQRTESLLVCIDRRMYQ